MSVELSRRALIGSGIAVAGGLLPVGAEPLDHVSLTGMRYIGAHILSVNPRRVAWFVHAATVSPKDAIDA